ncbi:kinase-like domain-containing protein [Aspergillus californicus]
MSLFRSAAELSSSDSDSNSDSNSESDHEVTTNQEVNGESQHYLEHASQPSDPDNGDTVDDESGTKNLRDTDAHTHTHSKLMTSALLEFFYISQAVDLLNSQHGSHRKYTRDSPEAEYLGKQMYTQQSRLLSSIGVLTEGLETDHLRATRQDYRANLNKFGLAALGGLNLGDTRGNLLPIEAHNDLVLASRSTRNVSANSTEVAANPEALLGPLDLRRRPGANAIPSLEDIWFDLRHISRPALPPPTGLPFLNKDTTFNSSRTSRYAVEFSQVRLLGKGSFGEVYHVKNHIDKQDYAVKKIPLSQRRLEQLQRGNENQLEKITKEIRTLARLEHANVVRYYGAWIEQNHIPHLPFPNPTPPEKLKYQQTLDDESSHSSADDSFGIVFEHSQEGKLQSTEEESIELHSNGDMTTANNSSERPLSRSLEDDVESIPRNFSAQSHSQLSTFDATDGDIFTDGLSHDQSQLQLQRKHRPGDVIPAVVLHIQMSLHPIPLSSYLSQQQSEDSQVLLRRHCYHLIPSLKLMLNIIAGVDYLHSKGIVHRDLKPANIFLSCTEDRNFKECQLCTAENGTCSKFSHPRIGDFGLVADISHLNDCSPVTSSASNTVPKVHRAVGTEFYCPPFFHGKNNLGTSAPSQEQYFDYTIDESLDVYALGVILFELLYRLNTKMERQMVLNELTRGISRPTPTGFVRERPVFPADFEQKIDHGSVILSSGKTVADSLKACIKGMLELQPHRRWGCLNVQWHLQTLLEAAQKSTSSLLMDGA